MSMLIIAHLRVFFAPFIIKSGPLNMFLRRNKKLFTLKGVLNKTGKRKCDCDETGYFISFILLGGFKLQGFILSGLDCMCLKRGKKTRKVRYCSFQ